MIKRIKRILKYKKYLYERKRVLDNIEYQFRTTINPYFTRFDYEILHFSSNEIKIKGCNNYGMVEFIIHKINGFNYTFIGIDDFCRKYYRELKNEIYEIFFYFKKELYKNGF